MADRKRPVILRRHMRDPNHPYYVSYSDPQLNHFIAEGRFPKPGWLSPYVQFFEADELDIFFANLPTDGPQDPPVLWEPQPQRVYRKMAPAMTYGRKPGGKVVTDPVTGKRKYVVPERRLITRPTRRDPPDDLPLLSTEAAQ